tara:strand:+ start:978 stop:1421 length:444 start_codon:yes stop_codon:yes gene_type:complete
MWYYKDKEFNPTHDELSSWVGFVYEIEDKTNGKKYIGKKTLWSKRRLPPLKGKKRKRIQIKESGWKDYYGSNEEVKGLVEAHGGDRFIRTVLRLCKTKGELSYYEAKEQFDRDVLFDPMYYNEFIGLKVHSKHLGDIDGRRREKVCE